MITILYILTALTLQADWATELKNIEFLINSVAASNVQFIRNGEAHDGKTAAKHLRRKFSAAQKSWFAPDKSKWTAQLFIEKIASKSSWSGKPYLIKPEAGANVPAKQWFESKLKSIANP